jgi:hypothetical protein
MVDAPNVAAMSPQQAEMRLGELQANPEWAGKLASRDKATFQEFDALSRKVAGVDAAVGPAASNHAQGQLDSFVNDPTSAKALLAGDMNARRRFHELTEAVANSDGTDQLVDLIAGGATPPAIETVTGGELTARDKLHAIAQLRESGQNDVAIAEIFTGLDSRTGKPFGAADVALARAYQTKLEGDPEWRARLLAGGYEERRQLRMVSAIIASGT